MIEQAGIYSIELIENKDISIFYNGSAISSISGSGQSIVLNNDQEIRLSFTPERSKGNKTLFLYELNCKIYDLSKGTKSKINSLKKSIYGWLAKVEFYDKSEKIILSPLKFKGSNINNNISNHYAVDMVNPVFGQKMVDFGVVDQVWVLETGVWNSSGFWLPSGIWNA